MKGAADTEGGGASQYLLHGENLFGGSSMLKQTVKLHFWSDLKVQTETVSQSVGKQWWNQQSDRKSAPLTSLLSSEAPVLSSLSADMMIILQRDTRHTFKIKQMN